MEPQASSSPRGETSASIRVRVQYMAQLRGVIGRSDEELSLRSGCSLVEVFHWIAETHGPSAGAHVLTAHGEPQPGLLVVVNGAAIASVQARQVELKERDTIMLLPPIAGG